MTAEAVAEYEQYLRSPLWRQTRRLALEHYGNSCLLCGSSEGIEVHHRSYVRRGRERLADLTVLCHDCHRRFHGK